MSARLPNRPPMSVLPLASHDVPHTREVSTRDRAGASDSSGAVTRREHFETIYRAELGWVHRTVVRLGARERDVEDLVHDVFIAFYRTLETYDPSRPLRPWLFGVAFRVVNDYRRKASFSREQPDAIPEHERVGKGVSADESVELDEKRRLILAALEELPLEQRAVFVELDETPVPELAAALQIPLNTCYSRLRLARARFATTIERLADRPRPPEGASQ